MSSSGWAHWFPGEDDLFLNQDSPDWISGGLEPPADTGRKTTWDEKACGIQVGPFRYGPSELGRSLQERVFSWDLQGVEWTGLDQRVMQFMCLDSLADKLLQKRRHCPARRAKCRFQTRTCGHSHH